VARSIFSATEVTATTVRRRLRVASDQAWFAGHFPGEPILAGVVQVQLAVESARLLPGIAAQPSAIHQLKFKAPIRPDCELDLELQLDASRQTVSFRYTCGTTECSSGRLLYASS
jgi:3-hydroxymyristoyl/3-hydroxydecanoyl-(acyl carrier protein) dehydratase